jgi:hypothetical protein
MKNEKSANKSAGLVSQIAEGINEFKAGFMKTISGRRFIRRNYVGYFAPLIAGFRLIKKRNWHFWHQLRVVYRYAYWRGKT